jgi:hypothetical protein
MIMQVLLGIVSESDLSDNDALYLTGLSKDTYFARFLAVLGRRAQLWAIAKNEGIPALRSNRDIITVSASEYIGPGSILCAQSALRMLGSYTMSTVNQELITILHGVVAHWLRTHVYAPRL